jgi:hypothetical protein
MGAAESSPAPRDGAIPRAMDDEIRSGRERRTQGNDLRGSGAAMLAVAAERRRRAARGRRRARAAAERRDRGEREAGEGPYPTGANPQCLGDGGRRRGAGAAATRGLRRRRCSGLGFARTGHDGGLGETLERRRGFIGRPRGVLASRPEAEADTAVRSSSDSSSSPARSRGKGCP